MRSKDLTPSTRPQDDFFDGALQTAFTKRWDLGQLNEMVQTSGGHPSLLLELSGDFPGAHVTHLVSYNLLETDETQVLPIDQLLQRIVCHLLVSRIPGQGLPELCESVGEIYEYYKSRSLVHPVLPPSHQEIPARQGKSYERPTFYASEE